MAFSLLSKLGMPAEDLSVVVTAIGTHDEHTAFPVNAVAAALILADKSDVRRSRVRSKDTINFDIHDRVNYAVDHTTLTVDENAKTLTLSMKIDTAICPVMDYFEIFTARMLLCRKATEFFGLTFRLQINNTYII